MVQPAESNLPYRDDEVSGVLEALVSDPALLKLMGQWGMPRMMSMAPALVTSVIRWRLRRQMQSAKSIAEFQAIVRGFVEDLVTRTIDEFRVTGLDQLDPSRGYLFLSNHRDIAGDSMLLNLALHRAGLGTVFIAVGDNLVEQRFATDLMRLNKSFFINRTGANPREVYRDLVASSSFIQTQISEGASVWLAQSEGRAKDAIDQTDESVLKMLQLSDRKMALPEKVKALKIIPMCLSYEFDPLDLHKARELRCIEETGGYEKTPGEDLRSLALGLSGHKGRVELKLGQPLEGDFEDLEALAKAVDDQILSQTVLYPINHWAAKKLHPDLRDSPFAEVSKLLSDKFEQRLSSCPPEDQPYWLQIYANPARRSLMPNTPTS